MVGRIGVGLVVGGVALGVGRGEYGMCVGNEYRSDYNVMSCFNLNITNTIHTNMIISNECVILIIPIHHITT